MTDPERLPSERSSTTRPSNARLALDVVVPVYNEQATLERSIRALHEALGEMFDEPWLITIADNASTALTRQDHAPGRS